MLRKGLLPPGELKKAFRLLRQNSHWVVLAYAAAACRLTYSRSFFGELPDALLFYLGLPVLILLIFNRTLRGCGLGFGNWKKSLAWTAGLGCLSLAATWIAVQWIPGIRGYYRWEPLDFSLVWSTLAYMLAWEFFFRGFMLFGLRKWGFPAANILQTLLFFLMHIGKPAAELYSTLLTGLIFGYVTWGCKSVYPMVFIHSAIFISVVAFAKM